ncbi:NADH-quinone oxidoreductase subunit D [Mycobacteroides abscessus subsp. massiliense]|nr:NADH-quinone oxidoreductase subunit D [Mycobacteroides abscessus subsp. massiliense]
MSPSGPIETYGSDDRVVRCITVPSRVNPIPITYVTWWDFRLCAAPAKHNDTDAMVKPVADRCSADGDSFYHLAETEIGTQRCQGAACFVARHRNPKGWDEAEATEPRVYCLGRCYQAPATAMDTGGPDIHIACDAPVILGRIAQGVSSDLDAYRAAGGYAGLNKAVEQGADKVLESIEVSGLRGRGGAGYPTGRKWRAAREQHARSRVIVVNADEGDPGAYIDWLLLEREPHAVLEGMAIAAVAVGADQAYIYVRREYPDALVAVRAAVGEAYQAGVLGESMFGGGIPLSVNVVEGQGSYVCGEETALLNALENRRPIPRIRPPYPVEHGLFGAPTVVNNVETLAAVAWILRNDEKVYAALGYGLSRGTKVVSLNSLFQRPGLYEVEFGIPLREIVENLGGGLSDRDLHGVMVGGPLAGVVFPDALDVPFENGPLRRLGAGVGHGGIVAFDRRTSLAELVHHVFRFGAFESCGVCTPCRVGAARIEALFASGSSRTADGRREWLEISDALAGASLCGHGSGLADFACSIKSRISFGSSP